jgi:hypothetical protein
MPGCPLIERPNQEAIGSLQIKAIKASIIDYSNWFDGKKLSGGCLNLHKPLSFVDPVHYHILALSKSLS